VDIKLPKSIVSITEQLQSAGFEVYAVGGAVRDVLLKRKPNDWDVATSANPEQIQQIFPDSVYENKFGTVGVKIRKLENTENTENKRIQGVNLRNLNDQVKSETGEFYTEWILSSKKPQEQASGDKKENEVVEIIEVTTYRVDKGYVDGRHPEQVEFTDSIREDLSRRDFTINAMALKVKKSSIEEKNKEIKDFEIFDPFLGQEDLDRKLIRAVGVPDDRLQEDILRMMRAVRFGTQLGFELETSLYDSIKLHADSLVNISVERIRDEFIKIIMSTNASDGVRLLQEVGLLKGFIPEMLEGFGVAQNKHHVYEVFEHNVRALDYAAKHNYSLEVRLASLFHDIGKPRSKHGKGESATFYNHEIIGEKMVKKLMDRLHFSRIQVNKVSLLVRYHQFYYDVEEVTASSVRRLVANVGLENINELIQVREADRIGSGVPKAVPYKLRHLKFMIEKVSTDPISPKMLKVKGDELMKELDLKPSKKLGLIINSLLAEVIENPKLNNREVLFKRAKELNGVSDAELVKNLATIKKALDNQETEIKNKYYVK